MLATKRYVDPQNDGALFGLPVVMDTRDDSVAVGDKILLTYQVRHGLLV